MCAPPRTDKVLPRAVAQIQCGVAAMEERGVGVQHAVWLVVRLRLDATPFDVFDPCSEVIATTAYGARRHRQGLLGPASGDGRLARLHDAIGTEFDRVRSDLLMQRLLTRALLAAALSVPTAESAQGRADALQQGGDADPARHHRPAGRELGRVCRRGARHTLGELHSLALPPRAGFKLQYYLRGERRPQLKQFVAERDFFVWLLGNNVSVCDLARASARSCKGRAPRATVAAVRPLRAPRTRRRSRRRSGAAARRRRHGQRWDRDLGFMYAPAIETLKAGFAAMGATNRIGALPPDERSLGAGAPRNKTRHVPAASRPPRPHFPLILRTPRIHARSTLPSPHHARPRTWHHPTHTRPYKGARRARNLSSLGPGPGCAPAMRSCGWGPAARRGAVGEAAQGRRRTIYYQTEALDEPLLGAAKPPDAGRRTARAHDRRNLGLLGVKRRAVRAPPQRAAPSARAACGHDGRRRGGRRRAAADARRAPPRRAARSSRRRRPANARAASSASRLRAPIEPVEGARCCSRATGPTCRRRLRLAAQALPRAQATAGRGLPLSPLLGRAPASLRSGRTRATRPSTTVPP